MSGCATWAIGIDIGGSHITTAVFSKTHDVIKKEDELRESICGAIISVIELRRIILSHLSKLFAKHADLTSCVGVGIGVPAMVDPQTQKLWNPCFPALHELDVPLDTLVSERYGLPCIVINDAEAAAFAEWHNGAGERKGKMLFFVISTGVGGAWVEKGIARNGEFGDTIIPSEGGWFSLQPLINTEWFKKQPPYYEEPRELRVRADAGDPEALSIFDRMGSSLGFAVRTLISTWRPDIIVFGGGISLASHLFLPAVKKQVEVCCPGHLTQMPRLVQALRCIDAGIYGAALLAFSKKVL